MSDENLITEENQPQRKRYYWIDHARGFIMILLVITEFLPYAIRTGSEIANFFLAHPLNQKTVEFMNFYDVGAPAFIFIMGILMPLSFLHRKERDGVSKAVKHMIIRYGIILALGLLVILIDKLLKAATRRYIGVLLYNSCYSDIDLIKALKSMAFLKFGSGTIMMKKLNEEIKSLKPKKPIHLPTYITFSTPNRL